MTRFQWIVAGALAGVSIGYWLALGFAEFLARYWGAL